MLSLPRYIYYLKKFLVLNICRFGMWIMITMNILKSEIVIEEEDNSWNLQCTMGRKKRRALASLYL